MATSLLNKYNAGGNPLARPGSPSTPATPNFEVSTLHDEYSLDGDPNALAVRPTNGSLPAPTSLANLDPITYKDTSPEGSSF
jgi:hypothetical protein|tara:strand:+ start:464 stop:709 length:246 start_codon:yes stop_codon:yes gene_type:complete